MKIKELYSELGRLQGADGDHRYVKVEVVSVKDELTIQAYFMYAERCVGSSLNLADAWDKKWTQLDAFNDAGAQRLGIATFDRLKAEALEEMNEVVRCQDD